MGLKTPPGGMNKTAGPEVLAIGDVLMDYQYWVDRFLKGVKSDEVGSFIGFLL